MGMDVSERRIELSAPKLGHEEEEALVEAIRSGWIAMGEKVSLFERRFADLCQTPLAVAVNSGAAALHLLLEAFGVGPNDEVLVPSLSFVATANAPLYTGATPVFVDIDHISRPHMSLDEAARKVTSKTKAVIVMHYGGYVAPMNEWRRFANERSLILIEDAAHAPGGLDVGRFSDGAAFSFYSNKNMTTAEGGMIVSPHEKIGEVLKLLRNQGMTTSTLERDRGLAFSYDVTQLGYNYRLDELRASLGLVQLDRLLDQNRRRQELALLYREKLEGGEVLLPFDPAWPTTAHLTPILLPKGTDRREVMVHLRQCGIQSSVHYPPSHTFAHFQERYPGLSLPLTEQFASRELSLPIHPALSNDDVTYVAKSLTEALAR